MAVCENDALCVPAVHWRLGHIMMIFQKTQALVHPSY
ncbi:UNVERIFIED_ORG: hypothetical protein QE446_005047 [Rhizobium sp. SORGH_AS260]|jgi:hypothetical protein|nr:hypothetical protein [Agrobacterium sp. RC10-4-1]MDP9734904.1 hypothetical protein [Rhizobium sp. SORGH_AS_0285]MDP9757123.1 hypothetical protein [Rhizobium sp. SORGH_AS_0260]MDR6084138.1 hypothetical protein [Agrobacterium sp. SORGH_AS_0440]